MPELAPIVLFTYCRLEHTKKVIESLLANDEAKFSDLIIYSDAPREIELSSKVDNLRNYLHAVKGFRSVTIHEEKENLGLFNSIIGGVNKTLLMHEKVIVLEDDLVVSPFFLNYMNWALEKYKNNPKVASIHAYVYPIQDSLPESFFLLGADCWGWGTWRRAWKELNLDGVFLLDQLKKRRLIDKFNFDGTYNFSKMLVNKINGKNNSWAILWYASTFLKEMVTLYPGRSLVANIGNDGTGTHGNLSNAFDVNLTLNKIRNFPENETPSDLAYDAFVRYFKTSKKSILQRLRKKLLKIL